MKKNALKNLLAFVGIMALILGGAENPDGSCCLAWTLPCLAVFAACGWLFSRINKKEGQRNV